MGNYHSVKIKNVNISNNNNRIIKLNIKFCNYCNKKFIDNNKLEICKLCKEKIVLKRLNNMGLL